MKEIIYVMIFGAMGALSRYGVGKGSKQIFGTGFPHETLIVNVAGCLIIGFLMQLSAKGGVPKHLHTGLVVGFLGAFTTFSAFGYATFDLLKQGSVAHAVLNAALNLALGLLAVWIGVVLAKTVGAGI
jgi:fluoride exporter